MREYRMFLLRDGSIAKSSAFFTCATDQEAIDKAQQIANGQDFEIWSPHRRPRQTTQSGLRGAPQLAPSFIRLILKPKPSVVGMYRNSRER
jgi:hypothetical protein